MDRLPEEQPDRWNSGLDSFAAINRRIARTEGRITRQQILIVQMLADGQDTANVKDAGNALAVHMAALQMMHECRETVLRTMNG